MENKTTSPERDAISTRIAVMIIEGASKEELAQEIRHGMFVIDLFKNKYPGLVERLNKKFNTIFEYDDAFFDEDNSYHCFYMSRDVLCETSTTDFVVGTEIRIDFDCDGNLSGFKMSPVCTANHRDLSDTDWSDVGIDIFEEEKSND